MTWFVDDRFLSSFAGGSLDTKIRFFFEIKGEKGKQTKTLRGVNSRILTVYLKLLQSCNSSDFRRHKSHKNIFFFKAQNVSRFLALSIQYNYYCRLYLFAESLNRPAHQYTSQLSLWCLFIVFSVWWLTIKFLYAPRVSRISALNHGHLKTPRTREKIVKIVSAHRVL